MNIKNHAHLNNPPIVIGGIGGSGTRLIAKILIELGAYIGSDLNEAYDNLWFTLLFKRIEILNVTHTEFQYLLNIFIKAMRAPSLLTKHEINTLTQLASTDRLQHSKEWLQERVNSLISKAEENNQHSLWGWKEPNTHIVLNRLKDSLPNMKYIHVVRNGLDMAYSKNQNQANLWGSSFLNKKIEATPYDSLQYWHYAHKRILELSQSMESNFLLLNYDNFCLKPKQNLLILLGFLNISPHKIDSLLPLISPPQSISRFKQHSLNEFSPEDIMFVKSMGFDTDFKQQYKHNQQYAE